MVQVWMPDLLRHQARELSVQLSQNGKTVTLSHVVRLALRRLIASELKGV